MTTIAEIAQGLALPVGLALIHLVWCWRTGEPVIPSRVGVTARNTAQDKFVRLPEGRWVSVERYRRMGR